MSKPISNVESIKPDLGPEPELEVDATFDSSDPSAPPPTLEVDADEATRPTKSSGKMGLLALILGLLLLGSIAINLQQARVTAALNAENYRFDVALNEAVATLDQETARANDAETTLSDVGQAVETVNERIESLREALGDLQSVTSR